MAYDQWAQVEIANNELFVSQIIIRSGYIFVIDFGEVFPTCNWTALFGCESTPDGTLFVNDYDEPRVGDVIRFAVVGSTIYVYKNGKLILSAVDNNNTDPYAGFPGLASTGLLDPHNPAFINFSAGSVTGSLTQSNRFTFHEHDTPIPGAVLYDVVDSGDGKTVGQILWDNIVARGWSFNLRDNQPFIAAGSSDAIEIQTFASALPTPNIITVYDPTVPASNRFNFTPVMRRSGQPALAYVVSDGPSQAYGSMGQIIWDGVFDRWAFLQTNAASEMASAADVNCIVNFAAELSLISPNEIQL